MKKQISLLSAVIPVFVLIILLILNVKVFKDNATGGANQMALLISASVAAIVGRFHGVSLKTILEKVSHNIQTTAPAILILLLVGSLAGTWLLSGIIPAMIYYGLQVLNPQYFLAACVIISIIVSMATGSSWTTSATIGIALIGIGNGLGIGSAMTAGAVISGAYFGDKMSILSDTTNLAPAMAGTDVYTHIKYMTITTVPTIVITLIFFFILGLNTQASSAINQEAVLELIRQNFAISPWLFSVPLIVIALIIAKVDPLPSLLAGTLLGGLAAFIFQPHLIQFASSSGDSVVFFDYYNGVVQSMIGETVIPVEEITLSDGTRLDLQGLFEQGGMAGMLGTVWLIICAMSFGGAMEAIGALKRISSFFLKLFHGVFGLFASTVASCLAVNITTSDQYLSIVIPGEMFKQAYDDKNLAPENLSRTLEDSATVTSVLIPWNTCGAYHSKVLLGQSGLTSYIPYAIFNYLSPFMTLLVALIGYKIRRKHESKKSLIS